MRSHSSQTAQRCSRVGARAEAIFQPLVSPCQLLCTFWPEFVPQGHKELSRVFHSSLAPLLPKIITDKFAAPCHVPKHAVSQATTLAGSPQGHTIQTLDTTSQQPSSGAGKLRSPWSQPRALAQHGVSRNLSFWATRVPNLEHLWHVSQSQAGDHRRNTELHHDTCENNH